MNDLEAATPSMQELLTRTSRTFALAIPLLPEPTAGAVRLAYLLFRVADTLEDGDLWSTAQRTAALDQFVALMASPSLDVAARLASAWTDAPPTDDDGYLALLRALPAVLAELERGDAGASAIVRSHVIRTAKGMRATVASAAADGAVSVRSLQGLKDYCYLVAGIVGELLTALFVHFAPQLASVKEALEARQVAFGEGLQLVNILKDEGTDREGGRVYLPADVPRAEVLTLAQADLREAHAYVQTLENAGAPAGFVAFTRLSAELSDATLAKLARDGAGAKVPRSQVMALFEKLQRAVGLDHSARAQSGK